MISVVLFALLSTVCNGVLLPRPSGQFQVSMSNSELVDKTRKDPWGLDTIDHRRIMISRFDPVPPNSCYRNEKVPYMPPVVAAAEDNILAPYGWPAGVLGSIEVVFCSPKTSPPINTRETPVVVLSTGLNTTRFYYAAFAQEVASRGFTVISIDHPFETDIVEFPDGTIALGGNTNKSDVASIEFSLSTRVDDTSFLLNELGIKGSGRNSKAVMFGGSFGGAAAAAAMMNDTRIRGGVNLDGALWGPVVNVGFDNPGTKQSFILWGAEGHNTTSADDWGKFWSMLTKQRVWKKELSLTGGAHAAFWDLPFIADVAEVRDKMPDDMEEALLGLFPGARAIKIVADYLHDFFHFVLDEKPEEGLLSGPNPAYPEVQFLG
ncbi:uncharacterized protein BP5553_09376 [Venustampulla echinocandica]|uniref:1-alkyl-2-acetylglycerophosphocholine esterase n=1 Tax=Venustampulla echinocandica TaxID=2656787 RepID=A0A370TCL3_9HELO|nr:uncharacterized protein BP5553_09376 [Venustampulla echinocandica]RDL31974.1 hypothetical protein BP5553_09376 [Venustampulla echinocandica]